MSTAACTFDPLRFLAPSKPARPPLSGVDWSVRLSRMVALGAAFLPAASRSTARRSCAMASKHPARTQRRVCCCTAGQGGRSWGSIRHGQPARTNQRRPL